MSRNAGFYLAWVLCLAVSQTVMAQQPADKTAQAAAAKAQFMLRQVSGEKAALEVKNKELQTQIDALTKKNAVLEREQDVAEVSKEKISGQILSIRDKYIALVGKYNEIREAYIAEKQNSQKTALKMQERDEFIHQCVENNKKLFTVNQEILGKYEDKGFWDVFNQKEPFTGLSQVDLENLVQEYQFQNEDARINEKTLPLKDAPPAETASGQ